MIAENVILCDMESGSTVSLDFSIKAYYLIQSMKELYFKLKYNLEYLLHSFIPDIHKTVYYKRLELPCFLILQSSDNFSNLKPKMDPSLMVKRRNILFPSYSSYSTQSSTLAILFYLLYLISHVLCCA